MGIGAGIGFLAAGAILYWAVEVDLPYIDDDALGVILIFAGALAVAAAVVLNARRAHGGTSVGTGASAGTGIGLIAAGAILYWAINLDLPYLFDSALGVILMAAGAIAVLATVTLQLQGARSGQPHQRHTHT